MSAQPECSWRDGLANELIKEILEHVRQFEADRQYEDASPSIKGTCKRLEMIQNLSGQLLMELEEISPVGKSMLFHESLTSRFKALPAGLWSNRLDRASLSRLDKMLGTLCVSAEWATTLLKDLHGDRQNDGRGSGSAAGKQSDLMAIELIPQTGIRSSKNKFAGRVIISVATHSKIAGLPVPKGPSFNRLLEQIWKEEISSQRTSLLG